ncbi:MAG: hypothetical protein J6W76_06150, partial [Spirochaetales bacterium]|nr:hypothetical protein [Spirochaetales bacterium]
MADENDIQGELIKKKEDKTKKLVVLKGKSDKKKPKIKAIKSVNKPDDVGVSDESDDGVIHDEISGFSYNVNDNGNTPKSAAAETTDSLETTVAETKTAPVERPKADTPSNDTKPDFSRRDNNSYRDTHNRPFDRDKGEFKPTGVFGKEKSFGGGKFNKDKDGKDSRDFGKGGRFGDKDRGNQSGDRFGRKPSFDKDSKGGFGGGKFGDSRQGAGGRPGAGGRSGG